MVFLNFPSATLTRFYPG